MNYIFKAFVLFVLGVSIVSCRRGSESASFDEIVPEDPDVESLRDTEISFVALAVDMSSSKAGYSNENMPNKFEINIKSEDSRYTYSDVDVERKDSSSPWVADELMYWADSTTPVEVEAFVPYRFTESTYVIQSDQSSAKMLEACDLLYYLNRSVMPTAKDVPIRFEHIMSKIYFKINLTNTGAAVDMSTNPISNSVIVGSLTSADISDPKAIKPITTAIGVAITPYTQQTGITELGDKYYSNTANSATAYYEAIFVPQTIAAGDLSMSLMVGDDKADWRSSEQYTFEGGKIYVITLNLALSVDGDSSPGGSSSELSLSSFSCSDWYNGENITVEAKPVE